MSEFTTTWLGPEPIIRHIDVGKRAETILVNTGSICDWLDNYAHLLGKDLSKEIGCQFVLSKAEPGNDCSDDGYVIKLRGLYTSVQLRTYLERCYSGSFE